MAWGYVETTVAFSFGVSFLQHCSKISAARTESLPETLSTNVQRDIFLMLLFM
jgi:hypothetical protein